MHSPGTGEYRAAAPRPARPALRGPQRRPPRLGLRLRVPPHPGPTCAPRPSPSSPAPWSSVRLLAGAGSGAGGLGPPAAPTSARPGVATGPRERVGGPGSPLHGLGVPSPPFLGRTDPGTREGGTAAAGRGRGGAPGRKVWKCEGKGQDPLSWGPGSQCWTSAPPSRGSWQGCTPTPQLGESDSLEGGSLTGRFL